MKQTVCEFIYVRSHWTVVIAGNSAESQRQTVDWNVGNGSAASGARACQKLPEPNLRLIVHISTGGTRVRIKISNTFGDHPLVIGSDTLPVERTWRTSTPSLTEP